MKYDQLATDESIERTKKSLDENGYAVFVLQKGSEALEKIKSIIPEDSTIINGASVTLETIGYQDYLATGQSGWINLHDKVTVEPDMVKRGVLRKQASISDFYLGSVNALTEDGQLVFASNTGSQLTSIAFNSSNLVLVIGTQKIVPTLIDALKRIDEYVIPLEDKHLMDKLGAHTNLSKILILKKENMNIGRKIYVILIKDLLGF